MLQETGRGDEFHTLAQQALAFFLVCIHKTTLAKSTEDFTLQNTCCASLSSSLALTNGRKWRIPHAHTACTCFFPRSHPQNDPREDSASCFSFALSRIRAASGSFCMDAHSALVMLCDCVGFRSGEESARIGASQDRHSAM